LSEQPGFFSEQGDASDFEMPGDAKLLADLRGEEEPEEPPAPEPEPTEEPELEPAAEEVPAADPEALTETPSEPDAEPEMFLGKFKTAEELAAAYQALESLQGRQSGELGELRRTVDQIREQTAPQPQQYDADAVSDHFAENPAAILPTIQQAYANGDMNLVWLGVHALSDTDPVGAEVLRSEIAKRAAIAEMGETLAPMQQQAATGQMQAGIQRLTGQYPEIHEFVQSDEFSELAAAMPFVRQALTEGTPEEAVSAIEHVYLIHRGRVSDNLSETVRDVARAAAEEGQAMREEAFVASATATTATPKRSRADQYSEGWDEADKLFSSGWNVDGMGSRKG
jgi:hypothetical protein